MIPRKSDLVTGDKAVVVVSVFRDAIDDLTKSSIPVLFILLRLNVISRACIYCNRSFLNTEGLQ